jgi:hypothetical protein
MSPAYPRCPPGGIPPKEKPPVRYRGLTGDAIAFEFDVIELRSLLLVPIGLLPLAVLVLRHLLAAFLDK